MDILATRTTLKGGTVVTKPKVLRVNDLSTPGVCAQWYDQGFRWAYLTIEDKWYEFPLSPRGAGVGYRLHGNVRVLPVLYPTRELRIGTYVTLLRPNDQSRLPVVELLGRIIISKTRMNEVAISRVGKNESLLFRNGLTLLQNGQLAYEPQHLEALDREVISSVPLDSSVWVVVGRDATPQAVYRLVRREIEEFVQEYPPGYRGKTYRWPHGQHTGGLSITVGSSPRVIRVMGKSSKKLDKVIGIIVTSSSSTAEDVRKLFPPDPRPYG